MLVFSKILRTYETYSSWECFMQLLSVMMTLETAPWCTIKFVSDGTKIF